MSSSATRAVDSIALRVRDRPENAGSLQTLDRALHGRKSQLQLCSDSRNRREGISRQQTYPKNERPYFRFSQKSKIEATPIFAFKRMGLAMIQT
jgi:hypothetical protein